MPFSGHVKDDDAIEMETKFQDQATNNNSSSIRKLAVVTVKELLNRLKKNTGVINYDNYTVDCDNQKDVREAILWAVENQETEFLSYLFKQGIEIQRQDDELLQVFITSLEYSVSSSSNDAELRQKPVRTLLLLLQNGLEVSQYGRSGWSRMQQLLNSDPLSILLEKVEKQKVSLGLASLIAKILIYKGAKLKEADLKSLSLKSFITDYCRATQDTFQNSVDWAIAELRSDMLNDIMVIFNSVVVDKKLLDRVLDELGKRAYGSTEWIKSWFDISCKQKLYPFSFELVKRGADIYLPFDDNGNTLLLMVLDQILQGDKTQLINVKQIIATLDLNVEVTAPGTDIKIPLLAAIVAKGRESEEQTTINRLVRPRIFPKAIETRSAHERQLAITSETMHKTLEVAAEKGNAELIDDLMSLLAITDEQKRKYQTLLLKKVAINLKHGIVVWLRSIKDCLLEPSTIVGVLENMIQTCPFDDKKEQYHICVLILIDLYKQRQQATQLSTVTSESQLPQSPVKYDALSKLILPAWDQDRFEVIELLVEGGADIDYVVSDDSGSLLWQVAQLAINDSSLRAKLTWLVKGLHADANLVFPRLLEQNYDGEKLASVYTMLADIASVASNLDKNILKKALIFTAKHGFTKTFQQIFLSFFTESTNVNAVYGETDMTLLMLAAQAGDNYSVMELLQKQADPRMQDKHGMTALMYTRKSLIATRIQNASSTFDIKDNQQKTALIHFIINNCSLDMLQEHLAAIPSEQCAVYVNHTDEKGMTALQHLVQVDIHIDVTKQIELLRDCGAEVDAAVEYVNMQIQSYSAIDSSQKSDEGLWGDLEWHQRLEALQTGKPDNQDTMSLCF